MSTLIITSVTSLIERDLSRLKKEIENYSSTNELWKISGTINNPAGNLCLHLCGNLQHYIGAVLGKSGYIRNREAEFALKDISKEVLLQEIFTTQEIVIKTLQNLDEEILELNYPEIVFDKPMTTGYFLVHLAGHLNYHLGQINYHRRLIQE